MRLNILDKNTDITELVDLLIDKKTGNVKSVSSLELEKFSQQQISMFCLMNAVYQLPTSELIAFLRSNIQNDNAIEIASGNGSIGRCLNIRRTDNRLQDRADVKLLYLLSQQPTITYPSDVETLDGMDAVEKYKPEVVIASWCSGPDIGNMYGVDESKIFSKPYVKKYIHIDNENTHSKKKILNNFEHTKVKADWLLSRSLDREKNTIYVFEKK